MTQRCASLPLRPSETNAHYASCTSSPPILGPGPEQMLLTFEGAEEVGEELLQAAVDRAEEAVAGRVPVTMKLEHGPVVPVLVETSERADRVVLQHRHMAGLRRVFTGSVCSGVAGRAHVPATTG